MFQLAGHTLFMFALIAVTSGDFGMGPDVSVDFRYHGLGGRVKKRWFLLAVILGVIAVAVIWPHISDKYFAKRILVVVDRLRGNTETLWEQTQGAGWQQYRSILAIGSGRAYRPGLSPGDPDPERLRELPARP